MLLALYLDAIKNQGPWKTGLLGSIQKFSYRNSQTQLETGKKKDGDCSNLGTKVTSKITNVYGQYQQMKLRNRDDQRSSVGRLWTEEDLHCMKIDVFCADIADSLNKDARIQFMKTFCNWNKDWQQPLKGVGPRGDVILEKSMSCRYTL
jgi:hypothetical protein